MLMQEPGNLYHTVLVLVIFNIVQGLDSLLVTVLHVPHRVQQIRLHSCDPTGAFGLISLCMHLLACQVLLKLWLELHGCTLNCEA